MALVYCNDDIMLVMLSGTRGDSAGLCSVPSIGQGMYHKLIHLIECNEERLLTKCIQGAAFQEGIFSQAIRPVLARQRP